MPQRNLVMPRWNRFVIAGWCLAMLLPVAAAAQTQTLVASGDTYLKSGSANQNQGFETILRLQSSGNNRALVRFDSGAITSAIGAGSLAEARLELDIASNADNWGSAGRTVDAHRLLAAWSEDAATWNCGVDAVPTNSKADCSPTWGGGTFAEEPSDTVLLTNGLAGWVSFDVTADVRDMAAGGANHGWLVKKTEEGQNGKVDFASREAAPGQEPRLVLVVESATFDQVRPQLAITQPDDDVIVGDTTPAIRVVYSDGGSGIDAASLDVFVDTTRVTPSCSVGAAEATCESPAISSGFHAIYATLRDHAGNLAEATRSFELLAGPGAHEIRFDAVADSYLRSGSPNQNQGTETLLRVRSSGKNRALVAFDGTAIAATLSGAALHSAHLELTVTKNGDNWGTEGRTVDAHRLAAAWSEAGATWNCADDANPSNQQPDCSPQWNGGTYVATPSASVLHTKGLGGDLRWDVTADVAALVAGESLHGWLLRKTDEGRSGLVEYASRETGASGPRLVIVFETGGGTELPPDPATIAPPLTPETAVDLYAGSSFLWQGETPVQTGVTPGAILADRICLVRGKVRGPGGGPLPGARVTVHRASELGQTLAREDGVFDLAVNGGGTVTLRYDLDGYLDVFRSFECPARDWAEVDDVVLVPLDPVVTQITPGLTEMQVARGSVVTDEDGTRQATLMFPGDFAATMTLADGTTQPLSVLHVRATEYTVGPLGPLQMPAELPENTMYNYAVELSADEALAARAKRVDFSEPIVLYVEDFVGFPIGVNVPLGYFDRERGVWIPAPDGRVIRILSIQNGLAELDVEGGESAATQEQLDELGISNAERSRLAALYPVGSALWRAPITHFTPWDCNWPYGLPPGAFPPEIPDPNPTSTSTPPPANPPGNDSKKPPVTKPPCVCGSVIDCGNQSLREFLPVQGTPYRLAWASDRVSGSIGQASWTVSLTGDELPPGLLGVTLAISAAGWRYSQAYDPSPNLEATVVWPQVDRWLRTMPVDSPMQSQVCFIFRPEFYASRRRDFVNSFSRVLADGNVEVTASRSTAQISVCRSQATELGRLVRPSLGSWDASTAGLGGWTLDVHHRYNPLTSTLYAGDGSRRVVAPLDSTVVRFAGTGLPGDTGDGGPARNAQLQFPSDVAFGADGSVLIVDAGSRKVRRVDPDGRISTFAGTGERCDVMGCGDGNLAVSAPLAYPHSVAIDRDGAVLIGDDGGCIRRVDSNGVISTVAGDCYQGPSLVGWPADLVVGSGGGVYFADAAWNQVRYLGTDGTISPMAGDTSCSSTILNVPALTSPICSPGGLSVDPDGLILVAGGYSNHVLRIGRDGILRNVAGNGQSGGLLGDGGPATSASLNAPLGVVARPDGSILVADTFNGRIRRIASAGLISSLTPGFDGEFFEEGMPPERLYSGFLEKVAIGPDRRIYVADSWEPRVLALGEARPLEQGNEYLIPSPDGSEAYLFDHAGLHLRTVNALTGATLRSFQYDTSARLVSIVDSDGNMTAIERGASGEPTAIIAPFGQRSELETDIAGYLRSVTNPAAEQMQLFYTGLGQLAEIRNQRHFSKHFSYDAASRLVREDDAAAGIKLLTGSADNRSGLSSIELQTAMGRMTDYVRRLDSENEVRWTIDRIDVGDEVAKKTIRERGGQRQVIAPDGTLIVSTEFVDPVWKALVRTSDLIDVRTPKGGLGPTIAIAESAVLSSPDDPLSLLSRSSEIRVNGRLYRSLFDRLTKTWTITTPAGRTSTIELDDAGRPVVSQSGSLEPVRFNYNNRGQLTSVEQGSGAAQRTTDYTYDPRGRLVSIRDPLLRVVGFGYDLADRMVQQSLPGNRSVLFDWDESGNLISLIPPGRPAHFFTYNAVDHLESYEPPSASMGAGVTAFEWNADRNPDRIVRPDGTEILLGYDSGQRPVAVTTPRGTQFTLWEPNTGRIQRLTTPEGVALDYLYDGPLVTRTNWSGTGITGRVDRTYDDDLRLRTISVNGANAITYSYDADSLVRQAGSLVLNRDTENGLLTSTTLGNITTNYSHNSFGELVSMDARFGATQLYSEFYSRDALGRIVTRVETIQGSTTTYQYGYDDAGRLETVTRNGVLTAQYSYDTNGNRTSRWTQTLTEAGTYDDQDRLLAYAGSNRTYTANGETLAVLGMAGATTYEYDAFGNLLKASLPGGTQVDYRADAKGRRIERRLNGVVAQRFLWEGRHSIIAELNSSSAVVSRFVNATRVNVPDYMIRGGATYRLITDHLGSPRLVVNVATGAIAQRIDYDEFGRQLLNTNASFQPFGFAGGLFDSATGIVRFGTRDYDASTGRWLAKDPVGFAARAGNLYSYTSGDPINLADPSGTDAYYVGYSTVGSLPSAPGAAITGTIAVGVDSNGNVFGTITIGVGEGAGAGRGPLLGYSTVPTAQDLEGGGSVFDLSTPYGGGALTRAGLPESGPTYDGVEYNFPGPGQGSLYSGDTYTFEWDFNPFDPVRDFLEDLNDYLEDVFDKYRNYPGPDKGPVCDCS